MSDEMVERVAAAIQNDSALKYGVLLSLPTCRLIAATAIEAVESARYAKEDEWPDSPGPNSVFAEGHIKTTTVSLADLYVDIVLPETAKIR